jgi:hypothetical protein
LSSFLSMYFWLISFIRDQFGPSSPSQRVPSSASVFGTATTLINFRAKMPAASRGTNLLNGLFANTGARIAGPGIRRRRLPFLAAASLLAIVLIALLDPAEAQQSPISPVNLFENAWAADSCVRACNASVTRECGAGAGLEVNSFGFVSAEPKADDSTAYSVLLSTMYDLLGTMPRVWGGSDELGRQRSQDRRGRAEVRLPVRSCCCGRWNTAGDL